MGRAVAVVGGGCGQEALEPVTRVEHRPGRAGRGIREPELSAWSWGHDLTGVRGLGAMTSQVRDPHLQVWCQSGHGNPTIL